MKIKLRLRFSIVLLVLFAGLLHLHAQPLPTAKPEEVGMSSERLQRLSAVFKQYADDKKIFESHLKPRPLLAFRS